MVKYSSETQLVVPGYYHCWKTRRPEGKAGIFAEHRYGERISTGSVESTVNQVISKRFCKKQQMQWTKRGTHLLLQTRVKTLNQELGTVFQCWYPDLRLEEAPLAA